MPSVALVHDHVLGRGGSERVLLSMHRAFPEASLHTAFYRPEATFAEFASVTVHPFAVNRVGWLRDNHRYALPILPTVFGRTRIDADVVLCGTSGWSAGVQTTGRKVLFVHSPTRWLNDQDAFLAGRAGVERLGLRLLEGRLRRWDRRAVTSADRHLVPSRSMAELLRAIYGVEAEVLAPPVTIDVDGDARSPRDGLQPGFVLYPARLVANKNVGVVMDAFRQRPRDQLVVAGDGPEMGRLRSVAPANVVLVGALDDRGMRWLYRHCRAVVSASHESFGLTTVEAAAFGRPALALRHGGLLDTVIEDETGVFFDRPEAAEVADAIERLDALAPTPDRLRCHAEQWTEPAFIERLRAVIAEESAR